jgi:hypothetical protein
VRQRKWRTIARNPAGNHFGWWEKYQERLMMRKDRRKAHSVCGMLDGNSNKLCDYVLSLTRTTGWEVLFRSQNLPKQQSEITFPQVDPSKLDSQQMKSSNFPMDWFQGNLKPETTYLIGNTTVSG